MGLLPFWVKRNLIAKPLSRMLSMGWDSFDSYFKEIGLKSFSGVNVTADTAMRTSAVYACVRLISEPFGSLPSSVMAYDDDGGRRVAKEHPAHRLIHKAPNEAMTPAVFKTNLAAAWALRGQSFSYVYRDHYDTPTAILPLHPTNVKFEMSKRDGFADYFVKTREKTWLPVARTNIQHFRLLTEDGFQGLGPLQLARDQIGAARAADEYSGRFFANDATPRGYLRFPETIKVHSDVHEAKKIKDLIRDDFVSRMTGEHRHKPPVFDQGLEWKSVGISPQDAQMLETRQFNVTDIARIFRIPPHMIADVTNTTSWGTGIEQMSIGFVVYTLMPWLVAFEQEIDRVLLLGDDDYYCKFNVRSLLRGDLKTEMEAFNLAITTGQMSVNEARSLRDMNPVEGGATHWRQLNLAPLDAPYDPSAGAKVTVGTERRNSADEVFTLDDLKSALSALSVGQDPLYKNGNGVNGNGHRG